MNSAISCVNALNQYLHKHKRMVTIDGKLSKVLSSHEYKVRHVKLCGLIIVGLISYIIRRYIYHPITVMGNTVYCRVIAAALAQNSKTPFVICKGNHRMVYYETEDDKELAFEGPSYEFFSDRLDQSVTLIPHLKDELEKLEQHTQLKNLASIQENILSEFKGGFLRDFIYDVPNFKNPIIGIRRFFGNLFYITTTDEIWITSIIIGDNSYPLQPNEIVSGLYGNEIHTSQEASCILRNATNCTVTEPNRTINLTRKNTYRVEIDLSIKSLYSCDEDECVIYSLDRPRPFLQGPIYTIHPFYFPPSWDPFLTIMMITRAIVCARKF